MENYKNTFIGSSIAFILATSCCWLPALLVAFGGGSTLIGLSKGLEKYSLLFVIFGIGLLGFGIFQYRKQSLSSNGRKLILKSTITCPVCGHKHLETMPTDACQFFYECKNCDSLIKPLEGDCCVYCSYGTQKCPPLQLNQECC